MPLFIEIMCVAALIMIITYLRASCEKFIIQPSNVKTHLFSKIGTKTPNGRITLEFFIHYTAFNCCWKQCDGQRTHAQGAVWFLLLLYTYVGSEEPMNPSPRVRLYRGSSLASRRFSWYPPCKKRNAWEMDNENTNEIYKTSIFYGQFISRSKHNHVHGLLLPGKLFILKIMFLTSCDCDET